MKNDVETYLALEGFITLQDVETIVHNNIKNMCFEELEKQSIDGASEILALEFLNILNTYFEIVDRIDVDQYPVSLLEVVDGFLNNLKQQILNHLHNQPVSTGLLFTWIPIVNMLIQSVKEINSYKFQLVTTYLELEVHKFTITHLNVVLNRPCKKLNNEESQPLPVNFYKSTHMQCILN